MQLDSLQDHEMYQSGIQVCNKTVMDTTDPAITFDEEGVCNYWHEYQEFKKSLPTLEERKKLLTKNVTKIKAAGKGKPYDCLLGLSGGVDSSYLAWLAKDLGLRPLVVHFDNGWNSELAVSNIEKLVSNLGYDLETFVMDWDEFRDLQRAYFKASVIDLEVPTDHMIFGALYKIASRHKIRFILSGNNQATEWLLPKPWYYKKFDFKNIKGIHKAYGELPMKKLPALGVWHQAYYQLVQGINNIPLLDYVEYNKHDAKKFLMDSFDWRDYGGKHYESIFTRFYQGYILPHKFNIDKRKAHLSSLILTDQMTREEALKELEFPTYDKDLQKSDKEYVAKKLGFSREEFDELLSLPNRPHEDFGTDDAERKLYFKIAEKTAPARKAIRRLLRKPKR